MLVQRTGGAAQHFLGGGITVRSGGGGAAAFSPLDLVELYAWWDFSDITSLFTDAARSDQVDADADVIGAGSDKSGNNRHATQATLANKPLYKVSVQNGLSASLFDGTNDLLVATFAADLVQPYAMYAAMKSLNAGVAAHLIGGRIATSGSVSSAVMGISATTFDFNVNAATALVYGDADADWHTWQGEYNGASSKIAIDGDAVVGDAGTRLVKQLGLGGNARDALWANCYIGEVILCSAIPSAPNQALIESYLNSKWGVY